MNELQWGFRFDPGTCIQCLGCEAACKIWRRTENGIRWRRVINVWHGAYPDVRCTAASLSCQHCAHPACMTVCPAEAITKGPDGIVSVDREKCIGCRACFDACPYGVPQYGADGLMQKCDLCADEPAMRPDEAGGRPHGGPPCVASCPTRALTVVEMTAEEKIKSERTILDALK